MNGGLKSYVGERLILFISKFEFEMRSSSNIETTRHNMTGVVRSNLKIGNGARLLLWHLKAYIKLDMHNTLNTFYSKKAPYIFILLSTLCLKPFYKSLNNADFLLGNTIRIFDLS